MRERRKHTKARLKIEEDMIVWGGKRSKINEEAF